MSTLCEDVDKIVKSISSVIELAYVEPLQSAMSDADAEAAKYQRELTEFEDAVKMEASFWHLSSLYFSA